MQSTIVSHNFQLQLRNQVNTRFVTSQMKTQVDSLMADNSSSCHTGKSRPFFHGTYLDGIHAKRRNHFFVKLFKIQPS